MRTSLVLSLALALVACKGDSKKTDPGPGTGTAKPAPTIDAAPAAAPTIDAAPAAAADTLQKPFFYKVTTKDGKVSHLLGSMHVGVPAERLPKVVWDASKSAKRFAMEADIMSNAFELLGKMQRTDGGSLSKDLGPEYWKKLDAAIGKNLPFPIEKLDGMKPMVAQMQLELIGLPPGSLEGAIDLVFLEAAKANKSEIHYLEDAGMQFDILSRWADVEGLKYQLDHLDELEQGHKELLAGYIAGDESTMVMAIDPEEWKAMGRKPEDLEKMKAELLYDRNAAWMPKIQELVDQGDAFIVVGAAHLVGERSVNDLLTKAGYTVERVTP